MDEKTKPREANLLIVLHLCADCVELMSEHKHPDSALLVAPYVLLGSYLELRLEALWRSSKGRAK
jgi:hypothetical protein